MTLLKMSLDVIFFEMTSSMETTLVRGKKWVRDADINFF